MAIAANELGNHFDDRLGTLDSRFQNFAGQQEALKAVIKVVHELSSHIDKDLEEGVVEKLEPGPLAISGYAKRYLTRVVGLVDNLATGVQAEILRTQGRQQALQEVVGVTKKFFDMQQSKVTGLEEAIKRGDVVVEDGQPVATSNVRRLPGVRPVNNLAERRAVARKASSEAATKEVPDVRPKKLESKRKRPYRRKTE